MMPQPRYSSVSAVSMSQEDSLSTAEAASALTQLMSGATNNDGESEINIRDTTVKGFRADFKLLPHQVRARFWMKDREDTTKGRAGGILADDMGFAATL